MSDLDDLLERHEIELADARHRATQLNPAAVEHAERCLGVPILTQDGIGQWQAECSVYHPEYCGWEVSGCESRAEAGATFYGHDPRGT